jgi:hypothetical protein
MEETDRLKSSNIYGHADLKQSEEGLSDCFQWLFDCLESMLKVGRMENDRI